MTTAEIVRELVRLRCRFRVEGDRFLVTDAYRLGPALREAIRERRTCLLRFAHFAASGRMVVRYSRLRGEHIAISADSLPQPPRDLVEYGLTELAHYAGLGRDELVRVHAVKRHLGNRAAWPEQIIERARVQRTSRESTAELREQAAAVLAAHAATVARADALPPIDRCGVLAAACALQALADGRVGGPWWGTTLPKCEAMLEAALALLCAPESPFDPLQGTVSPATPESPSAGILELCHG